MAGIQRTLAELQDQLEDQLYFLEVSALAYDQGQDREAKRLATALRVLVYDTDRPSRKSRRSRSILAQLNMKSQPFYDSALDHNACNWAAHAGLTCVAVDPHGSSPKILCTRSSGIRACTAATPKPCRSPFGLACAPLIPAVCITALTCRQAVTGLQDHNRRDRPRSRRPCAQRILWTKSNMVTTSGGTGTVR